MYITLKELLLKVKSEMKKKRNRKFLFNSFLGLSIRCKDVYYVKEKARSLFYQKVLVLSSILSMKKGL